MWIMAPKILVVDDDPKIIKIVQHALAREGFEVISAANGFEALDKVKKISPDLVLLDLMMPGMDGFETLQKLQGVSGAPVIILSARGDEVDKVAGFRMGVDDYQVKPFSPVELALRVKAVLRRANGSGESRATSGVLECGGLVIDRARRLVQKGKRELEITPKEFDLLWLMASHPNQVFTKAHLLSRVWETAYEGDDNTVNVHIRRLREKIEENPSKPRHIKTVWGVGYKFQE
jgi:DNA-binding response OmpR family regulator